MRSLSIKGAIAIAAAASIALFGAISTAEAGKKGGGGFKGAGGLRISSHAPKGAKLNAGPKLHSSNKAIRYSGGKIKVSSHNKPHHVNVKKGHGKYVPYRYYSTYPNYRRYAYLSWYGLPAYGGGCGWIYRKAVSTGSIEWWNRYYLCTQTY